MSEFSTWIDNFKLNEDVKLSLPKINQCNKVCVTKTKEDSSQHISVSELPFAVTDSQRILGELLVRTRISSGKEILTISLDMQDRQWPHQPGDTVGILPENKPNHVEKLLELIGLLESADETMEVINTDPKRSYLPRHSSYRELVSKFMNLHALPMKQTIATLATHTTDELDRRKMQYLASREGAAEYTTVILNAGTGMLEFLSCFPSCQPSFEVLLQLIPRLLPRPYSIASSPLVTPSRLTIVASILPPGQEGVCTGMLRRAFSTSEEAILSVYLRKSNGFRLPEDDQAPLILVGPGTGVAPFLGFLDHISFSRQKRDVYLFTGFRTENDFLFRTEISRHLSEGTLSRLFVSFSRQGGHPAEYVQDAIKTNGQLVGQAISNNAYIYVCGDFKKMTETVAQAFQSAIGEYAGLSNAEAVEKVKELRTNKRYLEDIWS